MKSYLIKEIIRIILLLSCFFSCIAQANGSDDQIRDITQQVDTDSSSPRTIYVIPIKGEVEPGMATFIARVLRDTAQEKDALFVLEIDTFGGRVDSALHIVDSLIHDSPGKTIAYVSKKAISAGSLIALACNDLVMRPNTTIGDCAPISFSQEGPKMLGEKFQTPLRAKFRSLARRNNYPPTLAESMVSSEMEVYEIFKGDERLFLDAQAFDNLDQAEKDTITEKNVVVAKGELLTMDDIEAHGLGFSRMSAISIEEMLSKMDIDDYEIIRIEPNWSETLGSIIASMAPFLLMIGLAGIYTELKSPGFGVPGIVGATCLVLVFFNQYTMGLANHTEVILIGLGIVLLGVEVFVIPGFGLAGIGGIGLICFGMILAFQDFVIPSPDMPWQKELFISNSIRVLGSGLLAFGISLAVVRYLIPSLGRVTDGPYLRTSLAQSHADSSEVQKVRIGDTGRTITALRPSGKMEHDRQPIDVVSEAEFIEKHVEVVVIDIQGNRVIVRRPTE